MLKAVVLSPPRYHSPTTLPLRITSRPVAPSASVLSVQAASSLSQSTPVVSLILAFAAESGSPVSGRRVRQPPCSSSGGKYSESAGGAACAANPLAMTIKHARQLLPLRPPPPRSIARLCGARSYVRVPHSTRPGSREGQDKAPGREREKKSHRP